MVTGLEAVLDHVAIAVEDWETAERRWRGELGGARVSWDDNGHFKSRQLRFAGGGKLELLAPSPGDPSPDNFVRRFLRRFGAQTHHVTLKVPHLHDAIATLRKAGLDPVDVQDSSPYWQEAFLRPSEVGGIVVQVAWSYGTDADWAAEMGITPEVPGPAAATFAGLRLAHPDLDAATGLWRLLGADVMEQDGMLRCAWPDSPLVVEIEPATPPGPRFLRFPGIPPLPSAQGVGPPTGP